VRRLILVLNPGSISTKLALFDGEERLASDDLPHSAAELAEYPAVLEQLPLRLAAVRGWLQSQLEQLRMDDDSARLDAIAARGGLLRPLPSGIYLIDRDMLNDLKDPSTQPHASNLAALIAAEIMAEHGVPGYCVDPVCVDEMDDVARVCGLPELERRSLSHALSLKSVCRRAAHDLGRPYRELRLVAVHLGGGISVSAHRLGRMVDVNDANSQGPFGVDRVGTLPLVGLFGLFTLKPAEELRRSFWGGGGMIAHLGTSNAIDVEGRIADGDQQALLVYRAMAYQVSKEVGAMSTVVGGKPDAIVLTGGLARSSMLVGWIKEMVSFIAPILVYPGTEETEDLARGVDRVLRKEEKPKHYRSSVVQPRKPWHGPTSE
jgi:butyrate kinase